MFLTANSELGIGGFVGMGRDWYALLIEPGQERRIKDWLRQVQNYATVYWPCYTGKVRLNRHRQGVRMRGVIPGYLFIASMHPHVPLSFRRILEHSRIHGVLRSSDGEFARITETDMAKIRSIEAALNSSEVCAEEGIPFQVGQIVRITNGLFDGHNCTIRRIDNPGRLLVEGSLFGRAVGITLPVSEIEAV